MKFVVRAGSDPEGRADAALLTAMGLPGGGVVRIENTHVLVRPGDVSSPNALLLGVRTMGNAGVRPGDARDAKRAMLPEANRVILSPTDEGLDARHLARSLQGLPVTVGDRVMVRSAYGDDHTPEEVELTVRTVDPGPAGLVGSRTIVYEEGEAPPDVVPQPPGTPGGEAPTTADALLTGLDTELEIMTGWLST